MAVMAGYKQTEVGIIPKDWDATRLGSLTTLMTNGFVGTATRHYAENENGVLYIQGYNVEENSFNFHGIKYVTQEFHKVHAKSCLRGGDLLTVQTGDVGLTTMVTDDLAGSNCHALIISRYDKKSISSSFISYYLNSSPGRSRLRLIETGTTMKHLNVGDMLEFLVPLPPTKAEQVAIAEALSDTDALIESLEQLITKKRLIKQGAMQGLITGKKRLPGFSDRWEIIQLGDVASFHKGKGLPKSALDINGIFPCIHYGELFTRYPETIKEVISHTNKFENDFRSIANDVLMPTSDVTPNGLAKASCIKYNDVILGGDILVIRSNVDRVCGSFLSYVIRHAQEQILQLVTGSTVFHIYASDMKKFTFPITSIAEQFAIVEILEGMDTELTALETKLTKTRALKQGMMHELLTGKTRLI